MFDRFISNLGRWSIRAWIDALTGAGLVAIILDTSAALGPERLQLVAWFVVAVWLVLSAEFLFKLARAALTGGPFAYLASIEGLIDIAAVASLPIGWLLPHNPQDAQLFGLIWALRYARESTGLPLFWRILQRSRTALLSIAGVFLIIFLAAATLAYLFERHAQPETFGSVPDAMWWAIVTLTTTGYGDAIPTTFWGRFLAGWVMVGGTVMFALQAGIIATAFAEELRRRHFLTTWDLVIGVPFFKGLGAAAIADIVKLVRQRDVVANTLIVHAGDPGDAMYFIVSGGVAVQRKPEPVNLGPGDFFGEMALLFGTPRSFNVVSTKPSVLLLLDIADFRELAGKRPEIVGAIEKEGERRRAENAALTHPHH